MAKSIQGNYKRRNWTGKGGQNFSSTVGEITSQIVPKKKLKPVRRMRNSVQRGTKK